jgi:hypothetical protein
LEVKLDGTKTARIRRKGITLCQGSERMVYRLLLPLEPSQFLLDQIEIHHKYDEPKESPHQRYANQQE